jgi:hypothetical protein
MSLKFDNGIPYVAFEDFANGHGTTVMKYVGSKWVTVGTSGFSAGVVDWVSLAFDEGTPYVAFDDFTHGYKVTVAEWGYASFGSNQLNSLPDPFAAGP